MAGQGKKGCVREGIGGLCLLGSIVFAAYFGATDAPAYVHARVLWVAIIGFLLIGRDDDQSWVSFIFWGVVYAMLMVGVVSTVSMWLSNPIKVYWQN